MKDCKDFSNDGGRNGYGCNIATNNQHIVRDILKRKLEKSYDKSLQKTNVWKNRKHTYYINDRMQDFAMKTYGVKSPSSLPKELRLNGGPNFTSKDSILIA